MKQKHALAIEDITGLGKCSLTVALPILSVAGLTCSVLPTAVLSTHPSGFTGYTYRDLTVDILPMAEHWKTEGLSFDAVYSGFLGSCEQLESVQRIFQLFGQKETICLVDPVMGDNGKLYQMYTEDMVEGMRGLCRSATILTPNLTEAAFLTGIPYQAECYSEEYIQSLVKGLAALGAPQIVLTGISFDETQIGAACYRASEQSKPRNIFTEPATHSARRCWPACSTVKTWRRPHRRQQTLPAAASSAQRKPRCRNGRACVLRKSCSGWEAVYRI